LRRTHPGLTILDASAAQLAKAGAAGVIAQPLGLGTAPALVCPVNNADADAETARTGAAAVGSHWSVLAFDRGAWAWRHFDSAGRSNEGAARELAAALGPWLMGGGGGEEGKKAPPAFTGTSPAAPRQANSHDCGVHACLTARALAGVLGRGGGDSGGVWERADAAVAAASTPAAAAAARPALAGCIAAAVDAREAAHEPGWVPPGLP
jgi:hypothetical protein